MVSLPLVFAFAELLVNFESSAFRARKLASLPLLRVERGKNFTDWLFARGTLFEFRRAQWPAQRELSAAHFAIAFAQFVFVERHRGKFTARLKTYNKRCQNKSPDWWGDTTLTISRMVSVAGTPEFHAKARTRKGILAGQLRPIHQIAKMNAPTLNHARLAYNLLTHDIPFRCRNRRSALKSNSINKNRNA